MKEYQWREERKKYQADFNKTATEGQPPAAPQPEQHGSSPKGILILLCIILIVCAAGAAYYFFYGKKPGSAAASFEQVLAENEHAVGVVCLKLSHPTCGTRVQPFGTAWAFEPHKFATNAHVTNAILSIYNSFLRDIAYKMQMKEHKVGNLRKLCQLYGTEILHQLQEETKNEVMQELYAKYQCNSEKEIIAKIGQENYDKLFSKLFRELMLSKHQYSKESDSDWCFERGKAVCIKKTNQLKPQIMEESECSTVIIINKMPQAVMNVTHVQLHPNYKNAYSPDVSILTVRETAPAVFKIASKEKLYSLKQGCRIAFLGFPMENLPNENINLDAPTATFQDGSIIAISDFDKKDTKPELCYFIRHNLPNPGGSSGSPIFDLDGEVIALNNSGVVFSVADKRQDSAALVNGAVRVDLLESIGPMIPIQEWNKKVLNTK